MDSAKKVQKESLFGRVFQPYNRPLKPATEVTKEAFATLGFEEPFVVKNAAEIGLFLPSKGDLTIAKVVEALGVNFRIPVIDVAKQETLDEQWTLFEWSKYFNKPPEQREKVYNVISLEISNTPLEKRIQRPTVVRELDLVDRVWPGEIDFFFFLPFCFSSFINQGSFFPLNLN